MTLQGFVWGKAFLLPDETAFKYLEMREVYLGGYEVHKVDVRSDACDRTVNATVYVATPRNNQWLGEAPVDELAAQVATCSGPAGHNAEYVLSLARWEREHAPAHRVDGELTALERLVIERLAANGVRPEDVLVNNKPSFSSMVPEKKLRCLGIWLRKCGRPATATAAAICRSRHPMQHAAAIVTVTWRDYSVMPSRNNPLSLYTVYDILSYTCVYYVSRTRVRIIIIITIFVNIIIIIMLSRTRYSVLPFLSRFFVPRSGRVRL